MKFSQMPYTRPEIGEIQEKLAVLIQRFKDAKTADEAIDVFKDVNSFSDNVYSMFSIANIRNTIDTKDEFYAAEKEYANKTTPLLMKGVQEFTTALLATPFRKEFEAKWGTLMFDRAEMRLKTFKPEIVADLQEENTLVTDYNDLIASAQVEYNGQKYTLAQMTPFIESPDRSVRESSLRAKAGWFMGNAEKFDTLYDKLVRLRAGIAEKLGYDSFTELGYYRMGRLCYGREQVESFRQGVKKYVVPIVVKLKALQAERIGVDAVKIYDDACEYLDGNAKPAGTPDDIFEHGKKMYRALSKETAEFFDFMLENELFDVLSKPGKRGGGYCAYISDHKAPFIFANFNGTSGDIDVLTHEAGHAYAAYMSRDIYPPALRAYTYETAEVHSMAMEFFTWPWMEGFFGDATPKYRESHLASSLVFLCYGTMVDEFQHHIYAKPGMTPKERNDLWLKLESEYRPYLDQKDFPFYGEGRRWQAQMHIYGIPFYYIDYCIARIVSLAMWAESQKDFKAAWEKYDNFVRLAGTKTFTGLVENAGLPSPFKPETIEDIANSTDNWLDGLKK